MSERYVQAWFNERLALLIADHAAALFAPADAVGRVTARIVELQTRRDKVQRRAEALITELADAPDNMRAAYRQKIAAASVEVDRLDAAIRAAAAGYTQTAQEDAATLFREHGLDWFWSQPDTYIHQILSALLGSNRLVVRDAKIIGAIPKPPRRRRVV